MDPVINPYTPGAGSRPPELTGRDKQIADFSILIKRMYLGKPQKSLIITGLRGVGKTVLLNTFQDIAESQGLKTAKIEITHETQFKVAIARQVRSIILSLSAIGKMKELSKKALGVLKAFTIKNAEGLELNIDVEAIHGIADSGDLETDISDLFSAAAKAAREHNTGIVFLIDEIQFLDKSSLEALISALHQTTQQNLPITLVGAGLPNLPALTGEAKSYAERLFQYPKIGKLNDQESKLALIIPAKKEGVEIKLYDIIYEAVEDIKAAMEGMLEPIIKETFLGRAKVKQVFQVSKVGFVAGCSIVKGMIQRSNSVKLIRGKDVIYRGKIRSLKHVKDDIKEAREGVECGIALENFKNIKPGDLIEAFSSEKITRRLSK